MLSNHMTLNHDLDRSSIHTDTFALYKEISTNEAPTTTRHFMEIKKH